MALTSGGQVPTWNITTTAAGSNYSFQGSSWEIPSVEAHEVSLDARGNILVRARGGSAVVVGPGLFKDLMALIEMAALAKLVPEEAAEK